MDFKKESYLSYLQKGTQSFYYYDIEKVAKDFGGNISLLPYSIRVLLESVVRQYDGVDITLQHIKDLVNWSNSQEKAEYPFKPMRVVLQDLTGVASIVDLASMRETMLKLGKDPSIINPEVPVDMVIDHSVQVNFFGQEDALVKNMQLEFQRNDERYKFAKWAQQSFENFRVVPPATGIVHQVNIEFLSDVVMTSENEAGQLIAQPDTLVGTDSHTTMVNGLGVLGWGVGGIEAEAAMLGEASYSPIPPVVGVELTGQLSSTVNATDLALAITEKLRAAGVVGAFVEYFGPGYQSLTLADRATLSNMAPEYGATCGFFPIDQETLNYLKLTNRSQQRIKIVESYAKANHFFYNPTEKQQFTRVIKFDLAQVETSLAGPKRPQDRVKLSEVPEKFTASLTNPMGNHGFGLSESESQKKVNFEWKGQAIELTHGSVLIASITSCTNTSNPYVMMASALLAQKAVDHGLKPKPYVKTSFAPGSKAVTAYIEAAGLTPAMQDLGFHLVGYGCTTCIGNSGELDKELEENIGAEGLVTCSVLSGNRNFEGRIHPAIKANYLASPPLIIAYALAGKIDIDWENEPIGQNTSGENIFLKDIWPSQLEINDYIEKYVTQDLFADSYANVFDDNEVWKAISIPESSLYEWDKHSTYIQNPPFFEKMTLELKTVKPLSNLRVLAKFGDSVTTDHISPAGAIPTTSAAGRFLLSKEVSFMDFNSYGSRRGNHEVMMRGTLANIRIRNQLVEGKEGSFTKYFPTGEVLSIYEAAMRYKADNTGLVILTGADYGMGSSRDWAAKGVDLLNVKAVIAKSFERIHRSNLVMMGVLPLEFMPGEDADQLALSGEESFSINITENTGIHDIIDVTAVSPQGKQTDFKVRVRFDSQADINYYHHEGILPYVIRKKNALLSI